MPPSPYAHIQCPEPDHGMHIHPRGLSPAPLGAGTDMWRGDRLLGTLRPCHPPCVCFRDGVLFRLGEAAPVPQVTGLWPSTPHQALPDTVSAPGSRDTGLQQPRLGREGSHWLVFTWRLLVSALSPSTAHVVGGASHVVHRLSGLCWPGVCSLAHGRVHSGDHTRSGHPHP